MTEASAMHKWMAAGIQDETKRKHASILAKFVAFCAARQVTIEPTEQIMQSVCDFLETTEKNLGLTSATTEANAGLLLGALRRHKGIDLMRIPWGRDAFRHMKFRANQQPPKWPAVICPADIKAMIDRGWETNRQSEATAILLAWSLVQRVCDVTLVEPHNIVFHSHIAADAIAVLFTQGKVVSRKGPFSAHGRIGVSMVANLQQRVTMAVNDPSTWFPKEKRAHKKFTQSILNLIREICPQAEQKSIRGTAFLMLGISGAPLQYLQTIGNHSNPQMTLHYLREGLMCGERTRTALHFSESLLAWE